MEKNHPLPSIWKNYLSYLLKWPLLALIIGTAVGALVWAFNQALGAVAFRAAPFWLFGLPALGGLATGLIGRGGLHVYGDGTQVYIDRVDEEPRRALPLLAGKLAATLLTLGTGGSGGRVGPFILIGSLAGKLTTRLRLFSHPHDCRVTAGCGAAAAAGAIFGAPLGGGIFAAEVLFASSLDYNVLLPAIISGTAGYLMNNVFLGARTFGFRISYSFAPGHILPILATVAVSSLTGMVFIYLYEELIPSLKMIRKLRWGLPVLGGAAVTLLGWLFGSEVLGTGEGIVTHCLGGDLVLGAAALLLLGKLLTTTATVASGGSGGLTFPAVILGALAGAVVSRLLNIQESGLHQALICTGIGAAVGTVLNTPVAAAIILVEAFGNQAAVPAISGAILGFMIGRPKVIYRYGDSGVWKKHRGL